MRTRIKKLPNKGRMRRTKTVKLKRVNCSPKPSNEMNSFSCYTNRSLYQLKKLWNDRHPDVKITATIPQEIHSQLAAQLSNTCNKESCWLRQKNDFGEVSELNDSFSPKSPDGWKKNPNEWLSSIEITNVMKQYEKAYPCFDFIGPSPIDFDKRKLYGQCVWEELCNFNLKTQIMHGKTKIGISFNTDPHDKPGQHWISLFINLKKNQIFFFDSAGDKAPREIDVFVKRVQKQAAELQPPRKLMYDSNAGVEHQYGNTECGMYSLYFIAFMLEDKLTKEYLKTHILTDEYISKYRGVFFNEEL